MVSGIEIKEEGERRKNSKETRSSDSSIGRGCFRARPSDDQEDPCLLSERNKPGREC